jgi:hypothetical protein
MRSFVDITAINDAVNWVRAHPERFFMDGVPSGQELARAVWSDAIFCGSNEVVTHYDRSSAMWVIGSRTSWLEVDGIPPEDLFARIVPLKDAGPNSMRSEVVVNAFSAEVAAFDSNRYLFTKGKGNAKLTLATVLGTWPLLTTGIAFSI